MDKFIEPLSNFFHEHSKIAAVLTFIIGTPITTLAMLYVWTTQRSIEYLKQQISDQQNQIKDGESTNDFINGLVATNRKYINEMKVLEQEVDDLKRKNRDAETAQQLSKMQARLRGMIAATQNRTGEALKAVETQDARLAAFRQSRQKQRNWFERLLKK